MVRVLALGDPHGRIDRLKKIPFSKADLILITGDLGDASFARDFYFKNVEREKNGLDKLEYGNKERKEAYMQIYNSSMAVLKYCSRFAPTYFIFGNVESKDAEVISDNKKYGLKLPLFVSNVNKLRNVTIIKQEILMD